MTTGDDQTSTPSRLGPPLEAFEPRLARDRIVELAVVAILLALTSIAVSASTTDSLAFARFSADTAPSVTMTLAANLKTFLLIAPPYSGAPYATLLAA